MNMKTENLLSEQQSCDNPAFQLSLQSCCAATKQFVDPRRLRDFLVFVQKSDMEGSLAQIKLHLVQLFCWSNVLLVDELGYT